ncbi:MAG: PH domain-containing protein [Anaerolineae bacterium]|nr:PH domain-containing protein [Anaerolineae bacterium]
MKSYKPHRRYLSKLWLVETIVAVLILIVAALPMLIVSLERSGSMRGAVIAWIVCGALDVLWWVPAMLLSAPYYRSLSYEIREEEVIVRAGIVTRSVKLVPYRTVTNLTVKRGLLDRWLGLGTVDIQTAGMSGTNNVEQSLVGLENAQEVYELVVRELRRFRGTATEGVGDTDVPASADTLTAILAEVRAIRRTLDEESPRGGA